MWNKTLIFILALLLASPAAVYGDPAETRVTWPSVQGARAYIVEIRNSEGITVFRHETTTSEAYPRLEPGEYRLRVIVKDAFMREAESTGWVTLSVIKAEIPVISSVEPTSLAAGGDGKVVIRGSGFMDGCRVLLYQNGTVYMGEDVRRDSSGEINCRIVLPAGRYELVVANPMEKASERRDFQIMSQDDAAAGDKQKKQEDDSPGRKDRLTDLYAGAGYRGAFVQSGWKDVVGTGLIGTDLNLSHSFAGLPFIPQFERLKYAGLELRSGISIFQLKDRYPRVKGSILMAPAGFGVYGTIPAPWMLCDLTIRIMGGSVFTRLSYKGEDVSGASWSTDPFASAGGSARYTHASGFFAEAGADWQMVFYKGQSMSSISPFLRIGMAFQADWSGSDPKKR